MVDSRRNNSSLRSDLSKSMSIYGLGMGNKTTLIVAFSAILVLFFGMTLFDDAQAMKSKGNSLTEVSSKQVCGNFLCDEPLSIAEKITIYLLTLAQQEETQTEILQQGIAISRMDIVTKRSSGGMSTVFPDIAKTPGTPGGPVPVPYPNIEDSKAPKASKLAAKLINKYDLKQEKLSPYLQEARVESGTLLEKDQLRSLGDKGNKVTGTNQKAIQPFEEQIASLAAQTGLAENTLVALINILQAEEPSQQCHVFENYILENEIKDVKIKLDSLQSDHEEFKNSLTHYDPSNPGHQSFINQLENLIENTDDQIQSIVEKISQKEFRIEQLKIDICKYKVDLNQDPDTLLSLSETISELRQQAIEEAERQRQAAEEEERQRQAAEEEARQHQALVDAAAELHQQAIEEAERKRQEAEERQRQAAGG